MPAPPSSYTAAAERYLVGAGIAKPSARIYRISLTTLGMLAGEPAPTGPARRGAKPPVFPVTAIDDPALPEVLAEPAAGRADEMDADTVYRELSIARKAIGWWQRQAWIVGDPTIGIERRPAPPDRTEALSENRIAALSRLDVALREKMFWKMLYESAARADEVLCLNAEDLYRRTSAAGSPPRVGRPSGSTGSPAQLSSCPDRSPAAPAARCSSPTARPRPEHRRSTCAPRQAGPGSHTAAPQRSSAAPG
ncbi:hypothetical protein [Streptomyces sp. NPDC059970]|uniref:hypothetical protein n=1 Tax=Streptomyces sp. NPDC059970 TaxID=3347019 RepID=UPI0036CBCEB6